MLIARNSETVGSNTKVTQRSSTFWNPTINNRLGVARRLISDTGGVEEGHGNTAFGERVSAKTAG